MKNDIDTRLQNLLQTHASTPFVWGKFDCCQFVLIAALALAGRRLDVPAYSTERGAGRVLAGLGGYDGAVAALGGEVLAVPVLAQRGDIVLVDAPGFDGGALAVCAGPVAWAAGPAGLNAVRMDGWRKAWRLECLR